ncbi:hypothetical protein DL766_005668 [Monosporascus sp. MC13-8B]|uniref:Uncharacterized protein n=1 Tax=Monosporascus cannonballus TaxID=155416 RepID=A0ABY0H525_9PEZI|nr:hypothetical protein DL762_005368 [Monosporascus cannonballus]RYO86840.1 hypothetical protein DL763_006548 [Monosporascus cannonballus]RYP28837.1 hypothetical protein DL766_005668 [Monosporascus sp. MC13-8B]
MDSRQPPTTSRPPRNIGRGIPSAKGPSSPAVLCGGINVQGLIWTGAFAAVTIVGAIYGAGLKTKQEFKAEKKQIAEASIEERIAGLEQRRSALVSQRISLENKLAEVRARMTAKELGDAGKNGASYGTQMVIYHTETPPKGASS